MAPVMKRTLVTFAILLGLSVVALTPGFAVAGSWSVLSATDLLTYSTAFDAAERGDAAAAELSLSQVRDPCLAGRVRYLTLAGPAPRKAGYPELEAWLKTFRDLPGADRIYALALKLKPPGARPPAPSAPLIAQANADIASMPASRISAAARQAYFGGELERARTAASADGDRWIAGLTAYRQARFADAQDNFSALTLDSTAGDEMRAAAAFWASRAAKAAGQGGDADALLRVAASAPDTFYGMIARRRLELNDDPLGRLLQPGPTAQPIAATGFDAPGISQLIESDPRARRAIALEQLGRRLDAGLELRTGLALAVDDDERAAWTTLALALNSSHTAPPPRVAAGPRPSAITYPTPRLEPLGGFTLNKALVYALTWQESRFNSLAVSHAGAIGLMQVMPNSVADIIGDDSFRSDPIPLFDPGTNLRLGQQYLSWLHAHGTGPDIFRIVAAYDGGPTTVQRTRTLVGGDDSLLLVESLPYVETRDYVRKVMTAYWSYRRQFGAESPTLDAVASGSSRVDMDLDQ